MRWLSLTLVAALATLLVMARAADHGPDTKGKSGKAAEHGHDHAGADKGHAKHDDHGHHGHHEPDPSDEVTDQPHWHFFSNSWFGDIVIPLGWLPIGPLGLPSKFMMVELVAAGIILVLMLQLAKRMQSGEPVSGPLWNALEGLVVFIRDDIARPNLASPDHGHGHDDHGHGHDAHGHGDHGHHHAPVDPNEQADRFVPFLTTLFLFILACNLLGLVPFMGSPTANIFVTGALALCSFAVLHGSAIAKMGVFQYLKSLWPPIDIPMMFGFGKLLQFMIQVMIFTIELFGTVIKCGVLAVRLFANMFAGHTVVASILFFIFATREMTTPMWGTIAGASVLGVVALSLLELFVAFLQAYIFTFLTALFTGMAVNPAH